MKTLLPALLLLPLAAHASTEARDELSPRGRYLEARSASVFAGPCHYNAELTTAGREALVAWSFEGGEAGGQPLAGARAVAAVVGERNLGHADARRESVLYLDAAAPPTQRAALEALLRERYAPVLGRVLAVELAPIALAFEGDAFELEVAEVASLAGRAMPDRACCSMPSNVWYRPLVETDAATRTSELLVGFTDLCAYDDRRALTQDAAPAWTLRDAAPRWRRRGENSAFLARFVLGEVPER